ncbi:MAG: zinc-ribbon domain-containing protein [Blautia sp.]
MFCEKCGEKIDATMKFCPKCGAPVRVIPEEPIYTPPVSPVETNPNKNNRKIGMIAAAVIVVAVLAAGVFLFGGKSYKTVIKQFFDATFEADVKTIMKLIPKGMVEYALEEEGYDKDELDEMMDDMEEDLQDSIDYMDSYMGDDWKVSYEILDSNDIKGEDLDDVKDTYKEYGVKVSAAKEVEVELKVEWGEDEEDSTTLDLSVIKVGRSWYLDIEDLSNVL